VGARILVVEDNAVNQKLAVRLLEKMGHTVSLAHDGREAVDLVGEHEYDAILMDCQMPVMDGFEATRCIREMEESSEIHVPIIALTANALAGDRELCRAAGMDDFLSKPVRSADLELMLERFLAISEA
jgi:CheY-like chemotaxis protein